MDVRDKGDLEALAKARRRDMALWRVAIGSVLACFILALLEVASSAPASGRRRG